VGVLSPPRRSLNVENFEIKERETFPTLRFDWQLDPVHRVSLGGEASFRNREAAKTTQQINDPRDSYQLEETQINLYLQDEIRLGTAHTFTIGTRLETLNATSTSFAGTRKQQSNTVLNPSLHYRFQASPITVLRASVARTVARPAFNQLIPFVITRQGNISQPDELGNPDLLPQAAWGFDVGLEQQFGNGLGLLGINGFYRDIDNLIETEVFINPANRRFQQRPVNIGSARAYGVEFDVRSRMDMIGISGLTLIGNISLLGSEVEDRFTKRIRRFTDQPAYIYNVGFDYTIPTGWLSFGLNYNYRPEIKTSDVRGDVIQVTTSKPLQSLDAYITVNFTKNLALSLYGRNLIPIQEIRPRQFFNTSGVLQSTQSDDQRSERILGATLSWQF
jgi:iron complex outermembrane receptor protein